MQVAFNPRRKHRRHRRNGRRHHRNPGFLGGKLSSLTAGFNTGLLMKGSIVVGGSIANNMLSSTLAGFIPVSFLKEGPGSYVTGLISAGLIGGLAKKFLPKYAAPLFFGAVLDVVSRATNKYIVPMLPGPKLVGDFMGDLADYLTPSNVRKARALSGYLTVNQAHQALSRPLSGDPEGNFAIAEEIEA